MFPTAASTRIGRDRRLRSVVDEVVEQDLAGRHRQERQQQRGARHAQHVAKVGARPHSDVLERVRERPAALDDSLPDRRQARFEQDDVGRRAGDVGGVVDAYANVGGVECRRVVDPVAEIADHRAAIVQRPNHLELLIGIDPGEDGRPLRAGHERRMAQLSQLVAGHDSVDREAHLCRDMAGDEVVVAGDDFERNTQAGEVGNRLGNACLGGIAEEDHALEDKVALEPLRIGDRCRGIRGGGPHVGRIEDPRPDRDQPVAFGRGIVDELREPLVLGSIDRPGRVILADLARSLQHGLGRALRDEHWRLVFALDDDAEQAPVEVVRQFGEFSVLVEIGRCRNSRENGGVERVREAGLELAVQACKFERLSRLRSVVAIDSDGTDELQPALGQRPGLVGAKHGHRAQVLDCGQPLHEHAVGREDMGALREVERHDGRQKLGREPHGEGDREEQRLEDGPVEPHVDGEDGHDEDRRDTEHERAEVADPPLEVGLGGARGEVAGDVAICRARTGRRDRHAAGAAHDARTEEDERVAVRVSGRIGGALTRRFQGRCGLPGQR